MYANNFTNCFPHETFPAKVSTVYVHGLKTMNMNIVNILNTHNLELSLSGTFSSVLSTFQVTSLGRLSFISNNFFKKKGSETLGILK